MSAGPTPPGARSRRPRLPETAVALSLPLPADEVQPGRLRPEEAVACAAPFDGEEWRFSVAWEGARVLLHAAADGQVRLDDERLRDLSAAFPEIIQAGRQSLHGRPAVIDGVLTVLDGEGCPDLPALAERLMTPADQPPARRTVLLATDLLHLDGSPLLLWPFDRRRAALGGLVDATVHLQVPEWIAGQGEALAAAAAERRLPAILARHSLAPYRAGVASPQRLRIALEERGDCVVVGVVRGAGGRPVAVRIAEWSEGRLVDAGRAAIDASPMVSGWCANRVVELRLPRPALVRQPGGGDEDVVWLRPELAATVRYHGRADDGRLRLASVVAFRPDRDPAWCQRRLPVPPPAAAPPPPGFRPTVIATLPLVER